MALNGPQWCSMALHCHLWHYMALKGLNAVSGPSMALNGVSQCYMALHSSENTSMALPTNLRTYLPTYLLVCLPAYLLT